MTPKDPGRLLVPMDLQLVLLPFYEASREEVEELIAAVLLCRPSVVEEVLQRPQDPDLAVENTGILQSPHNFITALLAAIDVRHVEIVRLLLEAGAHVTEETVEAAATDLQLVSVLLDAGAPGTGRCLYEASSAGCAELVRRLLAAGADDGYVRYVEEKFRFHCASPRVVQAVGTPLSIASQRGHVEVVQLLLHSTCEDHEDTLTGTPLYAACAMGHIEIVRLLLEAGANKNRGNSQESPLYVASSKGFVAISTLLLEFRADIHRGNLRETPLYVAASRGHVEIVRLLLRNGANKHRGRSIETPLIAAMVKGHAEIVSLLRAPATAAAISSRLLKSVAWCLLVASVLLRTRRPFSSWWQFAGRQVKALGICSRRKPA